MMAQNPLQQYFRQPKVFVSLPSQGVYNLPSTFNGDLTKLPVFGMTGMDEIILKTPDALITGESTVRVLQSCCPSITDAWDVSNLDIDALLVGVRIATYGSIMNINHVCKNCDTENSYEVNVSSFLDHFAHCKFEPCVAHDDLIIRIRPLNYKQVTDFNLENFSLQKQLYQASEIKIEDHRNKEVSRIYKELGMLQNRIMIAGIEQVEMPGGIVTDPNHITEWIENADKTVFDSVRQQVNANNEAWKLPATHVKCDSCNTENSFNIELDQSSFFASA